jgi:protein arginine N-methyltransferase 1
MYSVLDYGRMAADPVRMDAYARAIERVVKPGSVVVDLGAGTGILSILAARAGAKRVHAIEPNPAIFLIPDLARENGVADRITIHPVTSDELVLDERADVVVADLRGILPLHGENAAALRDARERLLAPGGVVIPERDRLFVALAESEGMWRWFARGWESFEQRGLASRAARTSILNTPYNDRPNPIQASDVISDSKCWATLDYATYDGSVLEADIELTASRRGVAHGFAVWFDATLAGDIGFTSAPGWSLAYSRFFLPLEEPIPLSAGERVRVTLRADARGERWAWDTTVGGRLLRQTTFLGTPTAAEALLRESSSHRPTLTELGTRVRKLLDNLDGSHSVEDLARILESELPEGSPLRRRALDDVREVVRRYAR